MTSPPRSPLRAALLSVVAPGLGHVYVGRLVPGLALLGAATALGPVAAFAVRLAPEHAPGLALAGGAGWVGLLLVGAVGAARAATISPAARPPGEVDRWYAYVVLALLAVPSCLSWAVTVQSELLEAFRVPTGSMRPTIAPGDRILVDKGAYRRGPVRRGDVVVFRNPDQPHQFHVKRVVALAGDIVELRDAEVMVVAAPRRGASAVANASSRVTVPHGHCFVLGDDRSTSVDSRSYGAVPLANLAGRVAYVWYPRWARLPPGTAP